MHGNPRHATRSMPIVAWIVFAISIALMISRAMAEPKSSDAATDAKSALSEFNELVGAWRGVGQVRRGSTDGAWSEKAEWIWHFDKKDKSRVAVNWEVNGGKQLVSAIVTWSPEQKNYKLAAVLPDKSARDYEGKLADGKWIFLSNSDAAGEFHRITITRLNEKRTLVLFEKRRGESGTFNRVAEVGYTREGTKLAVEGAGERECVVTGGKGTIAVSYKGETYYVCCTGCKQAFDDDPAGTLAEYKQRVAKRTK